VILQILYGSSLKKRVRMNLYIRGSLHDEAVKMIKELALIVPEVRYVGWDIALTDKGWVLIEGNDKGMFVGIQKTTQKGFRPVINRILNELDLSL